MSNVRKPIRLGRGPQRGPQRRAITITEAIVGMSVLVVVLSVMNRLYVGNQRLLQQARHQELVLDELTRHAEQTLLSGAAAMDLPPLSEPLLLSLPTARLDRQIEDDNELHRVTLTIHWQSVASDLPEHAMSRSLSVWLPNEAKTR